MWEEKGRFLEEGGMGALKAASPCNKGEAGGVWAGALLGSGTTAKQRPDGSMGAGA